MSVRTMARVWAESQHGGPDLLMLLAIADFADDDGNAYPSIQTLARKCRITPRNVNRSLAKLKNSGELQIRLNEGPRGTNRYRIVMVGMAYMSPLAKSSPPAQSSRTPDVLAPIPLAPASDEPSGTIKNHQSSEAGASAGKPADLLTESELWQAGADLLINAGMSKSQARPFIGKLVKEHGKEAAMEAVSVAIVEQPADPAAYIRAACRGKHAGQRPAVRHGNLENIDYRKGLHEDGSLVS